MPSMSRRTKKNSACLNCGSELSYWSNTLYCKKPACFSIAMKEAHKRHSESYKAAARKSSEDQLGRPGYPGAGRPRKIKEGDK